jgi:hypothetical protein
MHKQRSYWQGVKARVLPALLVGLVAAAAVWVADDSIKRVALLFIFSSASLVPPCCRRGPPDETARRPGALGAGAVPGGPLWGDSLLG